MAVATGQSQRFYSKMGCIVILIINGTKPLLFLKWVINLYSGVGIFNWYYLSSPPQILRVPEVHIETGGLMYVCMYLATVSALYSTSY
jgi:hypothetical protein